MPHYWHDPYAPGPYQSILIAMTDQGGQGDQDPVSQFSDPGLIHSYAESPAAATTGRPQQGWEQPPAPARAPRSTTLKVIVVIGALILLAWLIIYLVH